MISGCVSLNPLFFRSSTLRLRLQANARRGRLLTGRLDNTEKLWYDCFVGLKTQSGFTRFSRVLFLVRLPQ